MNDEFPQQIHASCVALGDAAVLLRGPSGSGKSDLAMRLIEAGAQLVADDRVDLSADTDAVMARAPKALRGLLEVRGLGILPFPPASEAPVRLVVDLITAEDIERLPEPETIDTGGIRIPLVRLDPFQSSAVMKVQLALDLALGRIIRADD